jgi:predicted metalloprotease
MRWTGRRQSDNIEDRRGGGGGFGGGGASGSW